jgi:two-component system, NtrC family, sensor histidine kinase HydH
MKPGNLLGGRGALVLAGIIFISLLHHLTPLSSPHWHNIYQYLYFLPVAWAALSFGWRGGLATGALAGLSLVPHLIKAARVAPDYAIDVAVDVPLFCAAGAFTGVLSERERRQRQDLERTTNRLTEVYQELQRNFEQMKRAERLYALGQLSAGLAHEIRNPLASIAGAAGILQRGPQAGPRQAECLEIISRECQRLNQLLTNFLDFARPRAPKYRAADPAKLLDSVVDLASHAIGRNPITLRKELAPGLAPLECDPELLKQVLLNLVINAFQAMPEGGEVALAARPSGDKLLIQIKDEGSGIREEDRDKIFDPFFTTKENGTGLGLPVAHQIVEQHGGILTAEANPGKGMTFSVLLPLRHGRAA